MRVFTITKERIFTVFYVVIILIGIVTAFNQEAVMTFSMPVSKKIVLIDSGHGGWDPGKVGDEQSLEKDINLQIAKKLQSYLEQGGSYVLTTRLADEALGDTKRSDFSTRREIANTSKADIFISIHQNSYTEEYVKGAQVFYYTGSEKSKSLAECIQAEIKKFVDTSNNRQAKANESYYLLKQTKIPSVIVECGFLSNTADKSNLTNDEYQEKIAWSIYLGIIEYFKIADDV